MRFARSLAVCVFAGVAVFALAAQQKPANVMGIEFQTPKNGMTAKYEAGRKAKIAFHKQKNDPRPLLIWEVMTGEHTGSYVVGQGLVHWADLDNPPITDAADKEEWDKDMGAAVQSLILHYYIYLPDVSRPSEGMMPSKYEEVITFNVRTGMTDAFLADMKKISDAITKTNWPAHYRIYSLAMGGRGGTFVLVLEKANYADFEPQAKTLDMMLADVMGKDAAMDFRKHLDANLESTEAQMVRFRMDLSYMPDAMMKMMK